MLGLQLRPLLHEIIMNAKDITNEAKLITWKKNGKQKELAGQEILMISEQIIREYVHIPKLTQVLISGRKYYNFGLRIKTELPVEYFVERWNYIKYKNREGY